MSVGAGQGGAIVLGVRWGADSAGIRAADFITAVGGRSVTSASDLTTALAGHIPDLVPGQQVIVTWPDTGGSVHRVNTNLGTGLPSDPVSDRPRQT